MLKIHLRFTTYEDSIQTKAKFWICTMLDFALLPFWCRWIQQHQVARHKHERNSCPEAGPALPISPEGKISQIIIRLVNSSALYGQLRWRSIVVYGQKKKKEVFLDLQLQCLRVWMTMLNAEFLMLSERQNHSDEIALWCWVQSVGPYPFSWDPTY